jgi:outer membrane efflux protein
MMRWWMQTYSRGLCGLFAWSLTCLVLFSALISIAGCRGSLPSERLESAIQLPVPSMVRTRPREERLSRERADERYELTPRSVIRIAFDLQPDIKSSYHRFKSEEARYDFFVTSRDSLTPTFRSSNRVAETRSKPVVTRSRDHTVELGVEKQFFDTTRLNLGVGVVTNAADTSASTPFLSADLRYPLWASREKLERTSEEIFRRNELNDALLGYIDQVRRRLQSVLFRFEIVADLIRRVADAEEWRGDLDALREQISSIEGRDVSADLSRLEAERIRVNAELRNARGRLEVDTARLKSLSGIPLYAEVITKAEPFNPFEGDTHEETFRLSIETDPEILTLRNEVRNSEVQLDLARRGKWDIALLLAGDSSLEGQGDTDGDSDWSVSVGFEVSRVDARVTNSLIRQAQARILRFAEAIAARENNIFVDTLEPIIRIETLGASRDELAANVSRYHDEYHTGTEEYLSGRVTIVDLLIRRESLWEQQREISRLTMVVGFNVAELCAATGKFFELLEERDPED